VDTAGALLDGGAHSLRPREIWDGGASMTPKIAKKGFQNYEIGNLRSHFLCRVEREEYVRVCVPPNIM
jgi:hypothetical protein